MKNRLIAGILIIMFAGCTDDEMNNATDVAMISHDQSGCNGEKSISLNDSEDTIIISPGGEGIYKIEHLGTWFNCCLPEGIEIAVWGKGDTIFFSEREKKPGECRCICPYNIFAEVGNVQDGEYVLCFKKEDNFLGSIRLFLNKNMYEVFPVSELTEYP